MQTSTTRPLDEPDLLGWNLLFQKSNDAMLMVDNDLNVIDANDTGLKVCSIGHNLSQIDSMSSQEDERRTITGNVRWSLDQMISSEDRVIFLKQNNADVEVDIYPVTHPLQGAVIIIKEPTESLNHKEIKGEPEKLYRLGMTAAGITHELSNPVSSLYSQLELMQSQREKPDIQLQTCLELVVRIRNILRELSGIMEENSALDSKNIDLAEIIPRTMNLLKFCPQGREANISHSIESQIPLLNISEKHLSLLLDNVCDNALKAAGKGGQIEIKAHTSATGGIELSCKNNGKGLKYKELIQHDIYTQGMGVGLMITRQIVESYQGTINISRTADGGTEVRLSFPAQCCRDRLDSE
ncbi:HAMP domain-containing sensor histidine kinase [Amphritea sp.]|uniref:sensor histidine kinase n=1 Tax=Amphritea sp. TaxID=1872502 RepID=UPI0025B911A2|nr:HAMP domain-containing sensor histidine kinase [Amphritea sp.]